MSDEHNYQDLKKSNGIHASTPAGSCMQKPRKDEADNILKVGGVVYALHKIDNGLTPNPDRNQFVLNMGGSRGIYMATPLPFDGEKKAEEKIEWEITAFRSKNKMHVYVHVKDDLYQWTFVDGTGAFRLHELLGNPDFEIYSVRNAAGLEITVGKKYKEKRQPKPYVVVQLVARSNEAVLFFEGAILWTLIDNIEAEVQDPIFTTESNSVEKTFSKQELLDFIQKNL